MDGEKVALGEVVQLVVGVKDGLPLEVRDGVWLGEMLFDGVIEGVAVGVSDWAWLGERVWLVDGVVVTMGDTDGD